ncbi:MAG: LysR family transcriptional regulator [Rhizobiales bacterium]|nr:LysR family transcriptional regulator [Hyphomicrobiales bacterium]
MHITFRQLRLFEALAATGSVSKAAAALRVTQPTASAQLKEITEAVGLPLYEVIGRRVHLTGTGQELAKTARSIALEMEAFRQYADGVKGLSRGQLRIAAVSTAKYFVPRLVGSFCKAHPGVDVSLQVLNRDGVIARLRENLDDIYIMSQPPESMELADKVFKDNPLVLIGAKSEFRGKRPKRQLADLKSQRFIMRERGSGTRMAVDHHFRKHRFRPDIRMELGSNEAIKEAVAGGLGIGVVSIHALQHDTSMNDLAMIDVDGFPIMSRWHVVHLKAKKLSPIADAFKASLFAAKPS